ncbi:MAG: RNA polymerase sigma factor [Planctomycetaceae bacterium]|nr:RNA polymerase sigma factor [Planctomycetales bacterium]MCB9923132.1 RNA polymerase sigma factor [Planctomycetaceae bacterium]
MVQFSESSTAADPDASLMLQVRAGSEEAFNQLVERYEDRIRGIITHLMGGSAYSDDLTQDVFLRVFRARRTYVVGAKFSTWLFTIVNNVVSNARRGLARRKEISIYQDFAISLVSVESLSAFRQQDGSPIQPAETDEIASVVRGCINRLVARQRTAIELCDIQGMSYSRVAKAIGTTPDAAKSLIHRGRLNLKEMLTTQVQKGNLL